jgi:lipoprotein NlpI
MRDDLEGAIGDFDSAITIKPAYAEAYNNRGLVRLQQGDLNGALADFGEAVALDPRYHWTSHASRTGTCHSGRAYTSAWARRWRAWRRKSPSARCCGGCRTCV